MPIFHTWFSTLFVDAQCIQTRAVATATGMTGAGGGDGVGVGAGSDVFVAGLRGINTRAKSPWMAQNNLSTVAGSGAIGTRSSRKKSTTAGVGSGRLVREGFGLRR